MNYLSEIVAFTEWKDVYPLPASAIALWYELMAVCNKAGWRQEFTVPNGLLQARAGLSRKELDNARQILIQGGRIFYKKSNRVNQAGAYKLIPFVQKGQQEGQQTAHTGGNTGGNVGDTLVKHKLKPKPKINKKEYAPLVLMTEEEYQKLVEQFDVNGTKDRIERLSLYKGSTGRKYQSDYLTILNWERKDKPVKTVPKGLSAVMEVARRRGIVNE